MPTRGRANPPGESGPSGPIQISWADGLVTDVPSRLVWSGSLVSTPGTPSAGCAGRAATPHLAARFGVPVAVDNDANLAALGEHRLRFGDAHHSITVKAGTSIGSGIIVDGRLHRGATSAAGDITHTRIDIDAGVACACGNVDCLETVASGAGMVRLLRAAGYDVDTTAEVLKLALDADPTASHPRPAGGDPPRTGPVRGRQLLQPPRPVPDGFVELVGAVHRGGPQPGLRQLPPVGDADPDHRGRPDRRGRHPLRGGPAGPGQAEPDRRVTRVYWFRHGPGAPRGGPAQPAFRVSSITGRSTSGRRTGRWT